MQQLQEYANSLKIKQLHLISTQPQQLSAEVVLRFYQLQALQWMINLYDNNLSGILADEMGLGKTIQAISFLTYLKFDLKIPNVQFLVVSPLSVLQNWSEEITKFSSGLNLFSYHGSKLERIELRELIQNKLVEFDVLLTTYETVINDIEFFEDKSIFNWTFLIVDEAHRLKNRESLLFKSLLNLNIKHQLLLTGTPIMNNLMELHSLLYFANPLIFDVDPKEFSSWFTTGDAVKGENLSNLRSILKIFMLRREKDQVLSLPSVKETVIYTNLSSLQKKIYKGILMKDLSVFNEKKKLKLMNVLMQLRKCVNHPYLFPGVEPEPFICGEHLVDVSSKLQVLDRLLNYFKSKKRKILIFSQMTQMLDILQDYLTFRRYSYERLDGSVRGEERFLAIKNFQEKKNDTFVFLLSTRAGGVGVNLTEASCVIFFDSDFNPQMDAQAQARAHRIGQLNEVLVIRLLARNSVEEIIFKRSKKKLALSKEILENVDEKENELKSEKSEEIISILKFGLKEFLDEENTACNEFLNFSDEKIEELIEKSEPNSKSEKMKYENVEKSLVEFKDLEKMNEEEVNDNYYDFEGHDYKLDQLALEKMKEMAAVNFDETEGASSIDRLEEIKNRGLQRKAELEQKKVAKLKKLWTDNGYSSCEIFFDSEKFTNLKKKIENHIENNIDDEEKLFGKLNFVTGSVTEPKLRENEKGIIIQLVDDSGNWPTKGIFKSIMEKDSSIPNYYQESKTNLNLKLGSCHLIKSSNNIYFCLLVVLKKIYVNNFVCFNLMETELNNCLNTLLLEALDINASIHSPRIQSNFVGFSWYMMERILRNRLVNFGVDVTVYYFKRKVELERKQKLKRFSHIKELEVENEHLINKKKKKIINISDEDDELTDIDEVDF